MKWVDGLNRSANVHSYLHQGISVSTTKSYSIAVNHYLSYCEDRGWNPNRVPTSEYAEEWIASLGDSGRISANTARVYKAAMSNWHKKRSTATDPFSSDRITLMMNGIERSKAEREQHKREAKPAPVSFTMDMARDFIDYCAEWSKSHDSSARVYAAAAGVATACALRPSELFGSANQPERRITVSQLKFYSSQNELMVPSINSSQVSSSAAAAASSYPHYFSLHLKASKTNQMGRTEEIHSATKAAVRALWEWRTERGGEEGPLFIRGSSDRRPLLTSCLLNFIRSWLNQIHSGLNSSRRITGKCFRRGGASTLNSLGATSRELNDIGRWRTKDMWKTYADSDSKKKRALETSQKM